VTLFSTFKVPSTSAPQDRQLLEGFPTLWHQAETFWPANVSPVLPIGVERKEEEHPGRLTWFTYKFSI